MKAKELRLFEFQFPPDKMFEMVYLILDSKDGQSASEWLEDRGLFIDTITEQDADKIIKELSEKAKVKIS